MRHPLALLSALLVVTGCPVEPVDPPPNELDVIALTVEPTTLLLEVGESAKLGVTGIDENGDSVDVADRVAFTSGDIDIAEVDATGEVSAFSVGDTEIIASVGLVRVDVPIRVVASGPPTGLEYDTPLLLIAGDEEELLPRAEGGFIRSYVVTPDLPRGLALDGESGVISGIPTVAQPLTTYTITGSNDDGSVQAELAIEIECIRSRAPPFDDDVPDASFVDENSDGIDGMACGPVFVSPAGSDDNDGLLESPMLTLGAAIARAASLEPKRPIYVSAGTYAGPLALVGGVSIIGGYDAGFARGASNAVRIEGGRTAVSAVDIDDDVTLDLLEIVADDAFFPGDASIGLLLKNAPRVTVRDVTIQSGRGADGEDGANGDVGAPGAPGTTGGDACESGLVGVCTQCSEPVVGDGPFSLLIDGNGGDGGRPGLGGQDGFDGQDGEGGAFGGLKGLFGLGAEFAFGLDGQSGLDGLEGSDGAPGAADDDGTSGADGTNGEGGGGGGGGAGSDVGCNDYGGAGGGGGAAGARGTAGAGGTRGGGSFAVVVESARFSCVSSTLVAGDGGNGGDGGAGGAGGSGGTGAAGGSGQDGSGAGGRGGDGGDGGRGGDGGGGGGGSSAALLVDDEAALTNNACTLLAGSAGQGGRTGGVGELATAGTSAQQTVGTLP